MGLKPFFFFFNTTVPGELCSTANAILNYRFFLPQTTLCSFKICNILVELGFLYLYEEFPMVAQSIAQCRVMAADLNTCRARDIGE